MRVSLFIFAALSLGTLQARTLQVKFTGILRPISLEILSSALADANAHHADSVVVSLQTQAELPGLSREMATLISHSPVPVRFTPIDPVRQLFIPTLRQRILSAIEYPEIALLLIVLGLISIYAEFCAPGLVLPGAAGAMLLLLGLASLSIFPLAWYGVLLAILGLICAALEAKFTSRGLLTGIGAVSLFTGTRLLIQTTDPLLQIRPAVAAALTLPLALTTGYLFHMAARARRNKAMPALRTLP